MVIDASLFLFFCFLGGGGGGGRRWWWCGRGGGGYLSILNYRLLLLPPCSVQLKHDEDSDTFSVYWVILVFPQSVEL